MRVTAWVVAVLSGIYGVRWSIVILRYSPPAYVRYALTLHCQIRSGGFR